MQPMTDATVTAPIAGGAVEPLDRREPRTTDVPETAPGPVEPESGPTPTTTGIPAIATTTGAIEPEDGWEGAEEAAWDPPVPPAAAAAEREPVRTNEPTPHTPGERTRPNEPSPAVGGDENPPNEPGGSGWRAALRVPALVCTLVILLAARLGATFASPVGKPHVPPDGRSGLAPARADCDGRGPFESAHRGPGPGRGGRRIPAPPNGPRPVIRPSMTERGCFSPSDGMDTPMVFRYNATEVFS
jgi:hypothetical protein